LVVEGGRRVLANAVDFLLNALQLAIRPAVNAVVTAELLERSEADAEILATCFSGTLKNCSSSSRVMVLGLGMIKMRKVCKRKDEGIQIIQIMRF